ncbi:uncharacterized protein LOC132737595 [Ruditapes philippinarum]|uniref:uncharacterized protein LOC132737595 n=1 Tax=Ruditapes philippinarum TaxID=129788 RepID=UPI00295B6CA4|nr:uncharacterized protein LOC132737595 [Ruditapes philippinarum]
MTLLDKRPGRLWLCLFVLAVSPIIVTSFVNYEPGYEYIYNIDSAIELSGVQSFVCKGKIGFTNIAENEGYQELLLSVYLLKFSPEGQPEGDSHHEDFSKWFSFEINRNGEIRTVYHPPDEDSEVLMMKKGFASMISAKLHHRHEVEHHVGKDGQWEYATDEIGREGQHRASYAVKATPTGVMYIKTRNSTIKHALDGNGTYLKTLHYHKSLNTIHSVMIKEERNLHFSAKPGFNPLYGMRPVKAVSNFSKIEFPQTTAKSNDKMTFAEKTPFTRQFGRPKGIKNSAIHDMHKIKKRAMYEARSEEARNYVAGNMTCIRNQPEKGSPELSDCFHDLLTTFEHMHDSDVEEIANTYFLRTSRKKRHDTYIMVDVFVALNKQSVIVNKVLNNLQSDEQLIMRALTLLTALDHEPKTELLTTIEKFCFKGKRAENVRLSKETRQVSCLTFGGLIGSVKKYGKEGHAEKLVEYFHNELGLHDPWMFKTKRSAMTEVECIEYDHDKVVLLNAIGNAGLSVSYDYIISHINSTNSQWIKRTGVHALRTFQDKKTLHELEKVALYDDDENVRYEALLQYKAHPLASQESYVDEDGFSHQGISKRGLFDNFLSFRLEAPGVDWRKELGSRAIGGSFGVIMENLLDLQMSLLKGHIDLRVHDEAYVSVHVGFLDLRYDFFRARICFKGGAKYALNILKEMDPELGFDLIAQFKNIVNKVVGAVRNGVEALRKILSDSLAEIVDDLVKSVTEIPVKVSDLGGNIQRVMGKLATFKIESMPPFAKSVMKFVNSVTSLYDRVKEDVLKFYNAVVQGIKVLIPKSAKEIFVSVQDIIKGFMDIFKDPKTSLFKIGAGVIRIYTNIKLLNGTIQEIKSHTFISEGLGPYWGDLTKDVEEIFDLYEDALSAIKEKGGEWIKETIENDIAEKITAGKVSIKSIKEKIVADLESEIQTLISPLEYLTNIGGVYLESFDILVNSYKDLVDAFETLKTGFEYARSVVDRIFGPKFHKDFPRERRVRGGGCSKDGFYPSKLGTGNNADEYENDGIDLLNSTGNPLVAPFSGIVIRSKNTNEIIMLECGELPVDSELVIKNVEPEEDIMDPDDPAYDEKRVSAGVVIGKVATSPCSDDYNHIHISIKRNGGFVDLSNYVPERLVELPKWKQICDDYLLVYKGETIKSGVIVGPWGRDEEDTSEDVPVDESLQSEPMSDDDTFDEHVRDIKGCQKLFA